jgi:hypothetical protein
MTLPDWELPDAYPRCLWADLEHHTIRESIYPYLTGQLTPELLARLKLRLMELRADLLARLPLFHYAAASGPPHLCVEDV